MRKELIISLFAIAVIFTVTGCGKKERDEKTGKDNSVYTCVKKGIERSSDYTGSYTLDVTNTAKLDDDGKLVYYSTKSNYKMSSKEQCDSSCDAAKKWNDEINDQKYSGSHRETTCNCDKNEYTEEYIYDDIPNLASIVRSDITELKADNTFDLESWLNKYKKIQYNCD